MSLAASVIALMLTLASGVQADVATSAPNSVDRDVRIADGEAKALRARALFAEDATKADLRVLISRGSGIVHEISIAAFREGVGRWRVEAVDDNGGLGGYRRSAVTATMSYLSPRAGADLDALLRDPTLYAEPVRMAGSAPIEATISIRSNGHTRDAVLTGGLPGLTGKVIAILGDWPGPPDKAH